MSSVEAVRTPSPLKCRSTRRELKPSPLEHDSPFVLFGQDLEHLRAERIMQPGWTG
jgi:hypothetical protein